MSLIDSKAEFESRCKDVCGSSALLENLRAKGIESFSSLAFACGTPQTPPTETEFASFAENVCGPSLRRLHFEAITLVVAQLKQQAIADPAEAVKKLPLAEKQARIEDQRRRLHGLLLEDELQPSHALIDACAHMIEQNHITWVPPSKCTKRDQELRVGIKDKSKFLVAAEGGVTLASAPTVLTADHQTPLQLQWCLQRRGLALDLNNIIGWTSHERWVSFLMQTLAQEVPAGYQSVTVDQLLKADCELFLLISKETKRVKVGSDGKMEAEAKLNQLKTDPRVTMHLLPLRGGGRPGGSQAHVEMPDLDDANARLKKRRTLEKKRGLLAPVKTATMPQELKACPHHTDSSGRRACWGFNLGQDARIPKDDCQSADHPPVDRDRHTTPLDASNPVDAASSCSSGLHNAAAHSEPACSNAENKIFHFPPDSLSDESGSNESEKLACQILAAGQCTSLQLLQLMTSLPCEDMARSSGRVGTEKSFTSGAYGQGPLVGLRKHVSSHAHVTRLLVKLAVQFFPALTFTTVALFRDVHTTRHSDKGNLPGSLNGVAALSNFSAGHIKLHTSDGERRLDVATCPVVFDPAVEHETCSWEGTRLVLVAFSANRLDLMSAEDTASLLNLGFPLPSVGPPSVSHRSQPKVTSAMAGDRGLVLHFFAGPARLAQSLQKNGFDVLAFDRGTARARFPVQSIDLCDLQDRSLCCSILTEQADRIELVFLSPPLLSSCSDSDPLAVAVAAVVQHAVELGLRVCIESPMKSALWTHSAMAALFASGLFKDVCFDVCMHGGHQNRRVRLSCNSDIFEPLALLCNRSHKHASDAMLHPADKGAYPWLLCHRISDLLLQQTTSRAPPNSLLGPAATELRVALDRQGKYRRPLVSEFQSYDAWAFSPELEAERSQVIALYPKGARIVRRKLCKWGAVRVCHRPLLSDSAPLDRMSGDWVIGPGSVEEHLPSGVVSVCGMRRPRLKEENQTVEVAWIGIPREPLDFLREAVKVGHPKSFLDQDEPSIERLVENLLGNDSVESSAHLLDEWQELQVELEPHEQGLRLAWPTHVQNILRDKKTELLKRLLCKHGYPDHKVVDHMREGFRLSGWMFRTGVYPAEARPPSVSMERQLATARSRNLSTLAKLRAQPCDEVTTRAWEETKAELERGWIFEAPCCEDNCISEGSQSGRPTKDFTGCFGIGGVLIARRFGILQSLKVRVIDDCKASGYNQTTGLPERFRLHGLEFLSAFLVKAMRDVRSRCTPILGRTYDLSSAYKQYAVHTEDRNVLRIGAKDTESGSIRLFGVNSLPFGATGSVAGFLRTAAATWFLGAQVLKLAWGCYFDDYPCLCKAKLADDVSSIVHRFFGLLGIVYATTGKKAVEFAAQFKVLGILVDLSSFTDGTVLLKHTEERIAALSATLQDVLDRDAISQTEADRLRGRMHWFSSFLFGRRSCLALLSFGCSKKLDPELRQALIYLKDVALHAEPISLDRHMGRTYIIFTDGSLEGPTAGLGGALFDGSGSALSFFGLDLPDRVLNKLRETSKHPIYEIEMLAVWAALSIWSEQLANSYSVLYIDNEAARGAFTSCKSGTLPGSMILEACVTLEEATRCRLWFGRVPTSSNIADNPSRGDCSQLVAMGASRSVLRHQFPL
ncbi:unnamed protein product [Symbiodinium sp. CCMP2592]|nr:unnamed protein product [Symbiodinium sp. CCMP2592]